MSKKSKISHIIAENRKAGHDYQLEQQFEAGLVLTGWEVKSLRAGHVQLAESHIILKGGEAFLLNAHFQPLPTTAVYLHAVADRTRKLLLHHKELARLAGAIQRQGYTLVPINLHWKNNCAKLELALAKGKKNYDKRATIKERDWQRQQQQLLKKQVTKF